MARSTRTVSGGALLILLTGLMLRAHTQTDTQTPQQPPVFRTGASLVRVDVTVTDRHGEPVTSLTADDFEIQEDGVPQSVPRSSSCRPTAGRPTTMTRRWRFGRRNMPPRRPRATRSACS